MKQLTNAKPQQKPLTSIDEIRDFFKNNTTPIYSIGPSSFNLIGLEKWISNFTLITYIDCFDGQCEHVFSPKKVINHDEFRSVEDVNNYLLTHPEVIDLIKKNEKPGEKSVVVFSMFDSKTEILAKQLNLEICLPNIKLRTHVDDKINTTYIAERAGVPCVPNITAKVNSYSHIKPLSSSLGTDLVIQTPFGQSGQTTFFISNEADYNKHAAEIEKEQIVKIMKRIDSHSSTAMESCVTNQGVLSTPLHTELIGFEELTAYRGGWCGNEIYHDVCSKNIREKTKIYSQKFGDQLWKEGYRGCFSLDFLIDRANDEVYLGELNPRLSGITNINNNAKFANTDVPIFLFHLLEWMSIPFKLDLKLLTDKWASEACMDEWSQMIIKHTLDTVEMITDTADSGIWKMKVDSNLSYKKFASNQNEINGENEAFYINITQPGTIMTEGNNLGVLILRGRLMTDNHELSMRAKKWINAIRSLYRSEIVNFNEEINTKAEDKEIKGMF
jgi:hypothetical protein